MSIQPENENAERGAVAERPAVPSPSSRVHGAGHRSPVRQRASTLPSLSFMAIPRANPTPLFSGVKENLPRYPTTAEAASILGVSVGRIYTLVRDGLLRKAKKHTRRFDVRDVLRLADERGQCPDELKFLLRGGGTP